MRGKERKESLVEVSGLKVEVVCERRGLIKVRSWMRRQVTFST